MEIPDIPAFHATFHGFHMWSKCKYEALGWMLLAKRDGHTSKIKAYLDSLEHLCKDLKERIELTQEQDRKVDLAILLRNSEFLHEAAKRILDSSIVSTADKAATKRVSSKHSSTKAASTSTMVTATTKRMSSKKKSTKRASKKSTKSKGLLSYL